MQPGNIPPPPPMPVFQGMPASQHPRPNVPQNGVTHAAPPPPSFAAPPPFPIFQARPVFNGMIPPHVPPRAPPHPHMASYAPQHPPIMAPNGYPGAQPYIPRPLPGQSMPPPPMHPHAGWVPPPLPMSMPRAPVPVPVPGAPVSALLPGAARDNRAPTNPALASPLTLFVGSIPKGTSDECMKAVLEQFGTLISWGRPIATQECVSTDPKPYGFVTFERGVDAWKCFNLLPLIDFHSGVVGTDTEFASLLVPKADLVAPLPVPAPVFVPATTPSPENNLADGTDGGAIEGVENQDTAELTVTASPVSIPQAEVREDAVAASACPQHCLGQSGASGHLVVLAGERETRQLDSMTRTEAELVNMDAHRPDGCEAHAQLTVETLNETLQKVGKFVTAEQSRAGVTESNYAAASSFMASFGAGDAEEEGDESILTEDERAERARDRLMRGQIEQFRSMQAARDKELELKKKQRLAARLQQLRAQERRAQERRERGEAEAVSEAAALAERARPSSEEDEQDSKRRKMEVLEFLNTSEALLSPEAMAASIAQAQEKLKAASKGPVKVALKLGGLAQPKTSKQISAQYADNSEEEESQVRKMRELITIDYNDEEISQNKGLLMQQQRAGQAHAAGNDQSMKTAAAAAAAAAAAIASKISGVASAAGSTPHSASSAPSTTSTAYVQRCKEIIDSIPTEKDDLFNCKVDWVKCVEHQIVETYIRPWLNKKMLEFLGEEEETIVLFILDKLKKQCHPNEILDEITQVLDDDAESFVIKLWRMLIYNIQLKSLSVY